MRTTSAGSCWSCPRLDLRSYGEVTVHAPSGQRRDDNEGFDAETAVSFTRERFAMSELEHRSF